MRAGESGSFEGSIIKNIKTENFCQLRFLRQKNNLPKSLVEYGMDTTSGMYKILYKACLSAAKIQLESYNKEHTISTKDFPTDIVTEVDLQSQKAIIESLTESMTELGHKKDDVAFIAEEEIYGNADHLFIVDPLDGTSSYVEGSDQFSICIAYIYKNEPIAGAIYDTTKSIFYFAEKGKGATKNIEGKETRMELNNVNLSDSIVVYNTSSSKAVTEQMLRAALALLPSVRRLREHRSIALSIMCVADNKYQIQMHGRGYIWDIAAAKLIVEEAGGIMTDWDGEEKYLNF